MARRARVRAHSGRWRSSRAPRRIAWSREGLELDLGVAQHVGVGRAAGLVLAQERGEDTVLVVGGEVDMLDLDADHVGHRGGVDEIDVARAVFAVVVVFPVLHEDADDLVACCLSSHALTAESTPPDKPTTTRSFLPMAAIIPSAARHTWAMDAIDERELQRWVGRNETPRRDVFGPPPSWPRWPPRWITRRATSHPARRCRPCGWLYFLPCAAPANWGRMVTPSRAAFCRRCRCRGVCGPAAASSSRRAARGRCGRAGLDHRKPWQPSRPQRAAGIRHRAPRGLHQRRSDARTARDGTTSSTAPPGSRGDVEPPPQPAGRRQWARKWQKKRRAAVPKTRR